MLVPRQRILFDKLRTPCCLGDMVSPAGKLGEAVYMMWGTLGLAGVHICLATPDADREGRIISIWYMAESAHMRSDT